MTDNIIAQLTEYFKNSKQEFSIGLQNFQGIREYTTIPLAPLTLLYGQNSSGKSTIHDAIQFIHGFFEGNWNSITTAEYLERWANHNRISAPLTKGYLGDPEDVVISFSSFISDSHYYGWESSYYKDREFDHSSPASELFSIGATVQMPFQIEVHFSSNYRAISKSTWHIRKFSFYFGDDICIELLIEDEKNVSDVLSDALCILKLNRQHLLYAYLDSFFEKGVESVANENMAKCSIDEQWLTLSRIDFYGELQWEEPIGWYSIDGDNDNYSPMSHEVLWFRGLLSCLLAIPTIQASRFDFESIPPLRSIPTKQTAIYRKSNSDGGMFTSKSDLWPLLAARVFAKQIFEFYPIEGEEENEDTQSVDDLARSCFYTKCSLSFLTDSILEKLNHSLSHPLFLNADYEIMGECVFLTPINIFKESANKSNKDMRKLLQELDAEVHLKLRQKSTGSLLEIEDVGVGISQIIPVLVAIMANFKVFVQQPELHLHPKLQAQLADVFIEEINKKAKDWGLPTYIIESHSEHFLLRLLRRIRETSKSDIKNKRFNLNPEHVSVLYVDKLEDGSSKIYPLRISPDGEFIDRWPNGFFTERDGELFDE